MQMQIAQNGVIYLSKGGGGGGTGHLGVIHNPNESGPDCIVTENGLYLDGASSFVARTPNFNQSYFYKPIAIYEHACIGENTSFSFEYSSNIDSIVWNFGNNHLVNNQLFPYCREY